MIPVGCNSLSARLLLVGPVAKIERRLAGIGRASPRKIRPGDLACGSVSSLIGDALADRADERLCGALNVLDA